MITRLAGASDVQSLYTLHAATPAKDATKQETKASLGNLQVAPTQDPGSLPQIGPDYQRLSTEKKLDRQFPSGAPTAQDLVRKQYDAVNGLNVKEVIDLQFRNGNIGVKEVLELQGHLAALLNASATLAGGISAGVNGFSIQASAYSSTGVRNASRLA
jgi:hypothetical protein